MDIKKERISCYHSLIVWSNARENVYSITNDLKQKFEDVIKIDILWDKHYFEENLRSFYSHSLKNKSADQLERIIKDKISHCGNGEFTFFLFEDKAPIFVEESSLDLKRTLNKRVFDYKNEKRKKLGGGHLIHASDNDAETRKDLALLFGKTIEGFLSSDIVKNEKFSRNVIGVPYYKDISELLFVLNNSINYLVLRNHEEFPYNFNLKGHDDIDLLVENLNATVYLTNAKKVFKENYRVHYHININEKLIPFDFRYIGDDYVDSAWENSMMNNKVYDSRGFYKLNDLDYFYSLLYHVYVQKQEPKVDYISRLKIMAENLDIVFSDNRSHVKLLLDDFFKENFYRYKIPVDYSVYFNTNFIQEVKQSFKGDLISSSFVRCNNDVFITEVFDQGKSILKTGNFYTINNEVRFLKTLNSKSFFPKIFNYELKTNPFYLQMEKVKGFTLKDLHFQLRFWNKNNITSFISDCVNILEILKDNKILHRDIRPENILVIKENRKFKPILIDFGWSIYFNESNTITPNGLGERFKYPKEGFSNFYSFGKVLMVVFGKLNFTKKIINKLMLLEQEENNLLLELKKELKIIENNKVSFRDKILMFIFKLKLPYYLKKVLGKRVYAKLKIILRKIIRL